MGTRRQSADTKKGMCGESCTIHTFLYSGNEIYYTLHSVVRHNVEDVFGEFGQIQLLGLLNVLFTPVILS